MSAARVITACLAATIVALMARSSAAVEPPADADVPAYRRVFVPEAQIENGLWTQGYLPIDATEFRRLTETVHARAIGSPGAAAAEIEVAEYTATLVDGDVLVGTAVMQLAQPAKSAPVLERWLLLAPCSFALADARWEGAASAAMLGTGRDGVLRVKADHGRLRCTWSLRAQRSASGAIVFPFELPRAPTTRLSIDAPSNLELMADRGIAGSSPGPAADTTRWTFELGGLNTLSLRAVTEGNARERRSLTLLRQSSTYEMSSRGVNLSTQLKLDIHSEALQRLSLDLDPELRLVSARYGELQIPFAVVRDAKTGASRVSLELPEPISALAACCSCRPWRRSWSTSAGDCRACGSKACPGRKARPRY